MNERRRSSLVYVGSGLGVSVFAFVLNALFGTSSPRIAHACALGISMGHTIVVLGCIQLALSKGKPWYFGLLGLTSCLGVGILWFAVKDESPIG